MTTKADVQVLDCFTELIVHNIHVVLTISVVFCNSSVSAKIQVYIRGINSVLSVRMLRVLMLRVRMLRVHRPPNKIPLDRNSQTRHAFLHIHVRIIEPFSPTKTGRSCLPRNTSRAAPISNAVLCATPSTISAASGSTNDNRETNRARV
jgi:hypothetical protein